MSLRGSFDPPGDKSISHRVALFSLLASGRCLVKNFASGKDCASSLHAVSRLGGEVAVIGSDIALAGAGGELALGIDIDCGNSGTTMRLLMGLLAGQESSYLLDGDGSLRRRPMERVAEPLRFMGARVECTRGGAPLRVSGGGLKGIDYDLPVASAQLKSALLLAGLQAEGVSTLREPYLSRDHTERIFNAWGGALGQAGGRLQVQRSNLTLPGTFFVPGDASSAAFFLCAAVITPDSSVSARGMLLNHTRAGFLSVLRRMGADFKTELQADAPEPWGRVTASYTPRLVACTVEAGEIPALVDEVPILSLVATQARGTTVFKEIGELRVKETDRIAAVVSQLGAMGAELETKGDDLLVRGPTRLQPPARLESFGDHRMAMTLRMAANLAGANPEIAEEDCAAISYPGFAATLAELSP